MRYPFLNFLRYAQLLYGMSIVLGGFFIAINAAFNNPFTAFNDNYLEVVRDRTLGFTTGYIAFVLLALISLAVGDFIKLFINIEDHLRSMRNDSQSLVADDTIREELVRSEIYSPLPPRWYERVGDAILSRINAEVEVDDVQDDRQAEATPQQTTQAEPDPSQQRTQPVKTIDNTTNDQKAEAAQHAYKQGVKAFRQGIETNVADDFNRAHALFEQALSIDPDHAKAREGLRATRKKLSTL